MPAILPANSPSQTLVSIPTPVAVPNKPKPPTAPRPAAQPAPAQQQAQRSVFRPVANPASLILPYAGNGPTNSAQSRANYRKILRAPQPAQRMQKKNEVVKRFAESEQTTPEKATAPTFYSQAEKVIRDKVPNSAHPEQIKNTLLNNGVKPEEMKWSGLEDHLAQSTGPVKKSDLLEHVKNNNVKLNEIWKSEDGSENYHPDDDRHDAQTKYHQYQIPGGSNYRELLLQRPTETKKVPNGFIWKNDGGLALAHVSHEETARDYAERKGGTYEQAFKDEPVAESFRSSHWDEPNVLAHVRMNDRIGPNGEKLLHVEELQSDLGQGIREHGSIEDIRNQHGVEPNGGNYGGYRVFDKRAAAAGQLSTEAWAETEAEAKKKMDEIVAAKAKERGSLPAMPMSKNWHELLLRRVLRHAAEGNYQGVSWTPGKEQADRYDLSKHVDSVHYSPEEKRLWAIKDGKTVVDKTNTKPEDLPQEVGKDVAKNLLAAPVDDGTHDRQTVSGEGLRVGGHGMQGFYDKMVPDYLNKYGKKWGAKVGTISVPKHHFRVVETKAGTFHILDEKDQIRGIHGDKNSAEKLAQSLQQKHSDSLPYIPITPAMRKSVLHEGQALFARKEQPKRFSLDRLKQKIGEYRGAQNPKSPSQVRGDDIFKLAPKEPKVGSPFITKQPNIHIDPNVTAQDMIDAFGEVPHPEDLGAMANHVDGVSTLIHNRNGPIESETTHPSGSTYYHAKRTFHPEGEVENDSFRKDPDSGIDARGGDIFRAQAEALKAHDFHTIATYAAGNPLTFQHFQDTDGKNGYIGYFVWPQLGFDGPLQTKHWKDLKHHGIDLDPSEQNNILDHINDPDFKDAWKHHAGSDIPLKFDLTDGSPSWDQLKTKTDWFPGTEQSPRKKKEKVKKK